MIQQGILWQRSQIEDASIGVAAYWDGHRRALSDLADLYAERAEQNWDGYGAAAIDPIAYFWARRFLMLLPTLASEIAIGSDPDGEVSLEWYVAPRRVFSVSIGREGKISYAGWFGRSNISGAEHFEDEIPSLILSCIRRVQLR